MNWYPCPPVQKGEKRGWAGPVEAIEGRASAVDAWPSPGKNLYPSPQDEFGEVK